MKNYKILICLQLVLSIISGVLVSKMSFLGRLGINIVYKEYTLFKTWWKTAIVMAIIQVLLTLIQQYMGQKQPANKAKMFSAILLVVAIAGLYGTYNDFTTTFSHKILKEKFHLGFYLFWLTWIIGNLYFLFYRPKDELPPLQDLSSKQL
ncbi:MAG: hypothetical protein DI598_12055 [Pseudopedobacter saltans]|uniref:Uncharacterized protein n=1 Tax=Pseudopedobacter saltans TaxID=151895 RepID=A0A2W5EX12_9SPHI|nr:MAG: hypothetical protein DI598_12055 [Pseudopedobacter saltans]